MGKLHFCLSSLHLIYTLSQTLIKKGIKKKEKKIQSCPPLLSGQGTVGQMVPLVLVQPGCHGGWLSNPGWLMAGTGRAMPWLTAGLPWMAHGGRVAATEVG